MIIIAYKPGQLANRLFLFAKFMAYGRAHSVTILNPSFDDYLNYFEKTKRQLIPSTLEYKLFGNKTVTKGFYFISYYVARVLDKVRLKSKLISITYLDWHEHFDLDNDTTLCGRGIHFIQGWEFQADKLLVKYKPEIKDFFSPAKEYQKAIDAYIKDLNRVSRKIVGLHIRQGDYKYFEGGKYFYEVSEYRFMMEKLSHIEPGVLFVICTNNLELTVSDFEGLNVRMGPGHSLTDLYVLSRCDYIVGPPSTYSLWASFYGSVPLYQIEDSTKSFSLSDFKPYLA